MIAISPEATRLEIQEMYSFHSQENRQSKLSNYVDAFTTALVCAPAKNWLGIKIRDVDSIIASFSEDEQVNLTTVVRVYLDISPKKPTVVKLEKLTNNLSLVFSA